MHSSVRLTLWLPPRRPIQLSQLINKVYRKKLKSTGILIILLLPVDTFRYVYVICLIAGAFDKANAGVIVECFHGLGNLKSLICSCWFWCLRGINLNAVQFQRRNKNKYLQRLLSNSYGIVALVHLWTLFGMKSSSRPSTAPTVLDFAIPDEIVSISY